MDRQSRLPGQVSAPRSPVSVAAVSAVGPDGPPPPTPDPLPNVRRHRGEMRETLAEVEQALAAPAPHREAPWGTRVLAGLRRLQADLSRHVELTEGDGGLYRDVLIHAPRLAHAVHKLEREHDGMASAVGEAMRLVEAGGDGEPWACRVRERVTGLLTLFSRHRQRGADLVYEAYETDIGGDG